MTDAMMYDIQIEAAWDQLISELKLMEGQRVVVAIWPVAVEERGSCSFITELSSPDIDDEEGREAIYYDSDDVLILIARDSISAAEWTVGHIGIITKSQHLTISRYVEAGGERGIPQRRLLATN